jgi:Pectate lyase superfamily protein
MTRWFVDQNRRPVNLRTLAAGGVLTTDVYEVRDIDPAVMRLWRRGGAPAPTADVDVALRDVGSGNPPSPAASSAANVSPRRDTAVGVSVKAFGATGDGSTNDTAALVAALASGEHLDFPRGVYMVDPDTLAVTTEGQTFTGSGRRHAWLRRRGAGVLLRANGTAAGPNTHQRYNTYRDLSFHGGDFTGTLLEMVYTGEQQVVSCDFWASRGRAIEGVELWDSRIERCSFEWCSDAATSAPVVHLRNSRAASGFGYSADNCNQVHFHHNRIEAFRWTTIQIEMGTNNTSTPNGFYLFGNKMESSVLLGGPIMRISDGVVHAVVDGLYIFAGNFGTGYAGGPLAEAIRFTPSSGVLKDILIANGGVNTLTRGATIWISGGGIVENVRGSYLTTPSAGHIVYDGGGPYLRRGNTASAGTSENFGPTALFAAHPSGAPLVRAFTASFTANMSDANRTLESTATTAVTMTLPANATVAYPIGTFMDLYQYGAGVVTIAGAAGVTVRGTTTTTQYGRLRLYKRATDEWIVST